MWMGLETGLVTIEKRIQSMPGNIYRNFESSKIGCKNLGDVFCIGLACLQ